MHSSRMRTGRSLTVCCSVLPGGGGVCSGGLPGPRGRGGGDGVCSGGVPGLGGSALGGVSALGGCLLWGGSPCPETPRPVNRITHTCKNITLATTLLWPVITLSSATEQL